MNSEIPQSVKKRSICSLRTLASWRRGLWDAAGANERIAGPITKRRAAVITLMLAVCVGPWGCALNRHRLPQQPSNEVRAQFNTIGLPAARFLPDTQLKVPGKGWGAAKGAGYGVAAGAAPGLAITAGLAKGCHGGRELGAALCGMGLLFGLGVAAAGGTVGALGGAVYGVVTAESASRISAVENEVKSAVVALNVQATLRDHVLRSARERSSLNFVALDDRGPTAVGEPIDYQALASERVDTVVEVSVPRIRLAGTDGINPPVGLFMTARARVIRTADGAELYEETFEYHSGGLYRLVEWGAEEGRVFRQEVDRGTRSLTDDIVRVLFPPDLARDSAPVAPRVEPVAAATASSKPPAASTPSSEVPARPAMPASPVATPPAPATANPESSVVSTDPKYTEYLQQVRQRIKATLESPCVLQGVACEYKATEVTIEFGIGRDGRVAFVNVLHPSPWSIYDEYSVRAIRLASPFPGVPESISRATNFSIRTTFKYFTGYATPSVVTSISDFADRGRPKNK